MSNFIKKIARPEILALSPYKARGGALGNAILLDANENPWAAPGGTRPCNRYPEQQPAALRQRLAALYGVAENQVLMTRGADEGIDLLLRATCRAGQDKIVITPPTFGLYAVAAQIQGAGLLQVALDENFEIQPKTIQKTAQDNPVKLIFLCSPNNPTGSVLGRKQVLQLAADCPDQILVVDEAYIEFAAQISLANALADTPNLVILRTLSKAYALAGARLGCVLANAPVIDLLQKILPPYPLPIPVLEEVLQALAPVQMAIITERIEQIKTERQRMFLALSEQTSVQKIWPSSANFLLLQYQAKSHVADRLRSNAIHVRDFSALGKNIIRISIGTRAQNDAVLAAFGISQASELPPRSAVISRQTKETSISALVGLDIPEPVTIHTGIGFFDHMLEQIARHGNFSLILDAKGDLHIDAHHTIEDCAIVLGQALRNALGNRAGIGRYGFVLPMDEAQAQISIDLSGRPALRFEAQIEPAGAGGFDGQMVSHFFETLSQHLGAAIHIQADGKNTHHIIEAIFKSFGRALRPALARNGSAIPSSKGSL
ncbi:Imidazoleglycerol-phosphate dehydratase [hydrothermal vent metagenome]|uniref:Imidazoleglycerol-phosphate dehydratase n=1 Tax=hydrothermal vent metagenome TaxID=652676 RepID=A0A3B0RVV0_9ZZZZ